ncbi:MAG: alpha/beta fold hydrolase [Gammaproteobacteria bacterium]|nr:alpha/beta fold hydrolase [Gammaproteobacteria bacterium]
MTSNHFATLVACLTAALWPRITDAAPASKIDLAPCELTGSGGFAAMGARCGHLNVPENPDDPGGREIALFVAVIESEGSEVPTDAFTFLAGGPGQAATTSFVDLHRAFELVRRDRDVVLVDQRGTGRSAPLECKEDEALLGPSPDAAALMASLRLCLDSFEADPRFYTTSIAVDDLERVRRALGYETFNVYGGSYGTRVGLHYLRKYPDSVRTLILDGVVPADISLGPGIALTAQQALENMFLRCDAASACVESFGNIATLFAGLQNELREQSRSVRLADPVTGEQREVEFGYDRFAIAMRLLSYAPESVAIMPLLIHEAANRGHYGPIAAQSIMIETSLSEALSFGMHNSVVCTEDVPFLRSDDIDVDALKKTYLGAGQLELLQNICNVWPSGTIDPDFKEPVRSDLPVLLLSGGADPITPPAYAERAAQTLSNHMHLVGKDMGHILAPVGCVPRLMSRYVSEASLGNLDAGCLDAVAPMPFFTSFNGPRP